VLRLSVSRSAERQSPNILYDLLGPRGERRESRAQPRSRCLAGRNALDDRLFRQCRAAAARPGRARCGQLCACWNLGSRTAIRGALDLETRLPRDDIRFAARDASLTAAFLADRNCPSPRSIVAHGRKVAGQGYWFPSGSSVDEANSSSTRASPKTSFSATLSFEGVTPALSDGNCHGRLARSSSSSARSFCAISSSDLSSATRTPSIRASLSGGTP
jgi:hypothetical protein